MLSWDAMARTARALSTWFGCGLSPVAPGTVGSLGAIPLHLVLCLLPPGAHLAAVIAVSVVGTWAAHQTAKELGEKDPQRVVIDEVAGSLIAMGLVRGHGIVAAAAALALFRLLDITKPGPIRRAEKLEPAGVGIMADDLLAGLIAGVGIRLLV